jgi:proliferating cell nuclear antigen PCNA
MKITLEDTRKISKLATIFCHLKPFTDNVVIYFKPTGLYIQCMDDGHCALFECTLDKTWFTLYDFNSANDMPTASLNIGMFYKVLNTREDDQTMEIELTTEEEDKIFITFNGGKTCKYFELPLINIDHDVLNTDSIKETDIDLTIEAKTLCDLINQLMIFDEVLTLTFSEEKIDMKSSGNEGSMKVDMKIDDLKEYAIAESTTLIQSYSLKYIHLMCQFNKLAGEINMGFSKDKPMTMRYDLLDDSSVIIHLAPKVRDDETTF